MTRILFPDVDLILCREIRERMPGIYVNRKVPENPRDEMIIVTRRGGDTYTRFIDRVRVGVNVYANTDQRAGEIAREVRSHLHALDDEGVVKRCRTSGPAEVPTDTNQSRFFFNAEFSIRGTQM